MSDNGDGTWKGVEADSSHPLEWQKFLVPMTTSDDTVELYFDVQPQEMSVRCWSDANWGKVNAKEENANLSGNKLELKEGGYIYEVVATWTGENLAAEGTAYYAFYVISDDHSHKLAEQPQTVDDSVTGYDHIKYKQNSVQTQSVGHITFHYLVAAWFECHIRPSNIFLNLSIFCRKMQYVGKFLQILAGYRIVCYNIIIFM